MFPRSREPIVRIERLLAEMHDKPQGRSMMTKAHRWQGKQTRRNTAAAKDVLRRLGL